MELSELRDQIDGVDRELIRLLEQRMDISSGIAAWKSSRGLPVLDAAREEEKLSSVRALCRPDTADYIADVFRSVMAGSRAYQAGIMEKQHGE